MAYTPIYTSVTYVQAKTGLSNTEVDLSNDTNVRVIIEDAEKELELLIGRNFTNANSITEYFSIKRKDILGNAQTSIQLNHFPVQSITEFKELDADENAINTYATLTSVQIAAGTIYTDDYWLQTQNDPLTNTFTPNGKITLKTDTFQEGTNNVKVAYTYGYSSVPVSIRNLATCLSGLRLWLTFIGGKYNQLNSYSYPEYSVTKGDIYNRGKSNIDSLTAEANQLLDRIGRKPRVLAFSSGDVR